MPGKVVLFFPSYYSDEAAPPLALGAAATVVLMIVGAWETGATVARRREGV